MLGGDLIVGMDGQEITSAQDLSGGDELASRRR